LDVTDPTARALVAPRKVRRLAAVFSETVGCGMIALLRANAQPP
jgi:hypothetical protein